MIFGHSHILLSMVSSSLLDFSKQEVAVNISVEVAGDFEITGKSDEWSVVEWLVAKAMDWCEVIFGGPFLNDESSVVADTFDRS